MAGDDLGLLQQQIRQLLEVTTCVEAPATRRRDRLELACRALPGAEHRHGDALLAQRRGIGLELGELALVDEAVGEQHDVTQPRVGVAERRGGLVQRAAQLRPRSGRIGGQSADRLAEVGRITDGSEGSEPTKRRVEPQDAGLVVGAELAKGQLDGFVGDVGLADATLKTRVVAVSVVGTVAGPHRSGGVDGEHLGEA